jgi:hypothetical protein
MAQTTNPLWVELKHLDESWHSNPGCKYAKMLRLIADRIPFELDDDHFIRHQTSQDVVKWLLEQAHKGDNDIRYNYPWENTDKPR